MSTRERTSGQGRQVRVDERMGGAKVNEGACPKDGVCVREIGVCERDRCVRERSVYERDECVRTRCACQRCVCKKKDGAS